MPKPNKISSPFGSYAPDYAEVRVLENVSNFDLELDFTATYQKNINEHVAIREARCLEILLPRIFQEIKKGDIFAGRTEYRQIGFGLENASGGPGFYCYEHNLRSEIENSDVDAATRERLEAAIEIWSREATIAGKLVGSLPEDVRKFTTNQIASMGGRLSGAMLDFNKLDAYRHLVSVFSFLSLLLVSCGQAAPGPGEIVEFNGRRWELVWSVEFE